MRRDMALGCVFSSVLGRAKTFRSEDFASSQKVLPSGQKVILPMKRFFFRSEGFASAPFLPARKFLCLQTGGFFFRSEPSVLARSWGPGAKKNLPVRVLAGHTWLAPGAGP